MDQTNYNGSKDSVEPQKQAQLYMTNRRQMAHTQTHSRTDREPANQSNLCTVRFVSVALILVDYVARRKPVNRGVKDGHNHPAGKPLLLPQAVQVTVADLSRQECEIVDELKCKAGTSEPKSAAD